MRHRFFVEAGRMRGDEVQFSDDQARQIRSVLRLRAGDQVRVFDGVRPTDEVVELSGAERGRVVGTCAQAPEPRTRLIVYPALLQRDKFEPVLQKLTEIGASAIVPVVTARSLVRDTPDDRRLARWRSILREAAEQCGRGRVPELLAGQSLLEAIGGAQGRLIMAYEGERRNHLRSALSGAPDRVALFVGPEGGFAAEEAECARRAGALLVTLGPRVLRTETASLVLAALVLYELGDLSWPEDDPSS
jgi:16S rRNA (uracil1498-N3)-methyltransferase